MMILYSSSSLALPAAVKSTYCFGFQMKLVSVWMTSVKDGIDEVVDMILAVQPVVL